MTQIYSHKCNQCDIVFDCCKKRKTYCTDCLKLRRKQRNASYYNKNADTIKVVNGIKSREYYNNNREKQKLKMKLYQQMKREEKKAKKLLQIEN